MVSFFGIKLGGDRKKSQTQSSDKPRQASRSVQRQPIDDFEPPNAQDLKDLKEVRRLTNNFSRPNFIRPATSSSTTDPTQWRAPYMAGSAASSSLVDLGAPRAPGLGNPRFHSSDVNLNSRPRNGSTASMMPLSGPPMGGVRASMGASSSDIPARPGTAVSISTKLDNPFKNAFGRPGSTSVSPISGNNPLDQLDFNLGRSDSSPEPAISTANSPVNGYPSPPPSILSADQPFSPTDGRPSSSRRNAPSGLRNMETTGPRALPSPAASVARTSEETWDPPVMRTTQPKRDTLTFHTPRRQSFSMEVRDYEKQKAKPMVEGLAGNFAAFDFGDVVKSGGSSGKQSFDSDGISPTDTRKPKPFPTARTASPLRSMQSSPSLSEMHRLTRERTTSDATSFLSYPESLTRESPIPHAQPVSQPVQQPVQQPTPQPAAQPAPKPSPQPVSQAPKYQYHDVPISLRPPAPPPTTAIPPTPTNPPRRDTAPVVAPYGSHPGYMSRPLDPPPRGLRARVDSDTRTRGLRVPAPLVDRSGAHNITGNTRSPYGPPPEEGNYMRTDSPSKPPEVPIPDSPFTRGPYEGDFPVQRGLPRGRRPPGLESPGQGAGGLSPRVPSRQRPMYPPPKSEPSPAPSANDYSSALPDWDDFGRSHRGSAMPAPLTPKFPNEFTPQTPPNDGPASPSRGLFTSSPISPKAPSLPSPTFASLQNTISSSSENLAKSFELVDDDVADYPSPGYPLNRPLISPVMAEFSRSLSPSTRVEAKKAPPRPIPITVPPSADSTERERAARAPRIAVDSFSPGFI